MLHQVFRNATHGGTPLPEQRVRVWNEQHREADNVDVAERAERRLEGEGVAQGDVHGECDGTDNGRSDEEHHTHEGTHVLAVGAGSGGG